MENRDMEKLKAMAQSSAGQALLTLLRREGGAALDEAVAKAAAGDYAAAQKQLAAMLSSPEAQALLRQLEEHK